MSDTDPDRVAIVTGSARGIGLAIARRLHGEGVWVVLADIDTEAAQSQANGLYHRAMPARVDVADPECVDHMVADVLERWGRIDVLVNNAGIAGRAAPVTDYPLADWRRIMAINVDGVFHCTRAVLPHMLER